MAVKQKGVKMGFKYLLLCYDSQSAEVECMKSASSRDIILNSLKEELDLVCDGHFGQYETQGLAGYINKNNQVDSAWVNVDGASLIRYQIAKVGADKPYGLIYAVTTPDGDYVDIYSCNSAEDGYKKMVSEMQDYLPCDYDINSYVGQGMTQDYNYGCDFEVTKEKAWVHNASEQLWIGEIVQL